MTHRRTHKVRPILTREDRENIRVVLLTADPPMMPNEGDTIAWLERRDRALALIEATLQ